MDLGTVGIWSTALRYGDAAASDEAAAELEELGYGALWVPGGVGGDVFGDVTRLLDATRDVVVATGVLNVWMHDPDDVASGCATVADRFGDRFLLGIGVSHRSLVERTGQTYAEPLRVVETYLDRMDAAARPVPHDALALAALGPRMLGLARDRTAGAHPYLVTPDHSARARDVLGDAPLLAPEQAVVLSTDPGEARSVARRYLDTYLRLPNYTRNLRRLGFGDDDLAGGGSDRLADAIVAWGDDETIVGRVREHHDAGADHVCVQVLVDDRRALPRAEWRRLAEAFGG